MVAREWGHSKKTGHTEVRFAEYLARLAEVIGHADRREPLRAYMAGLLLPGERKSVEPMAAKVDPRNVESRHQSMHHFVADAPWEARNVIRAAREWALEQFERHGPWKRGSWASLGEGPGYQNAQSRPMTRRD
jgi:SRSO17 transposase